MKDFNYKKAYEGDPICLEDGRKARIICFNRNGVYPLMVLVEEIDGLETVHEYSENGISLYDSKLMMASEQKEGWINIYHHAAKGIFVTSTIYATKEEAITNRKRFNKIDTVKITWEE